MIDASIQHKLHGRESDALACVQVRLSANLKAQTVEELRGRRRALHLAAFDYANAETARSLARVASEGIAEARLARDPMRAMEHELWLQTGGKEADLAGCGVADGKVTFTVEGLLGYLLRGCEAVRARHAAAEAEERFADDGAYRAMAGEMLAACTAAESCLHWYLEDPGRMAETLMRTTLMAGHRSYLGFLERTLPAEGEARAVAAGRLCRAMGAMGASADEEDAEGLTALMRAAADGAGARVLRSLVAARAGVEARDRGAYKATAVWWAAYQGHAEAVAELGRLGADVNAVGEPGAFDSTPMYIAAHEGHVGAIEALGRLGADVNRAVLNGSTPLYAAAAQGHIVAVEALGRLGADVNRAENEGMTPVLAAVIFDHAETVEALVRLGADLNLATKGCSTPLDGFTPLGIARRMGRSSAVAALERLGAL